MILATRFTIIVEKVENTCTFAQKWLDHLLLMTSSYRGATLWNSLPYNLRQEKSLNRFKQLLNFHFS